MEVSPVKFISFFLVLSSIGWIVFTFAARLVAWTLSRILGASVQFRVASCNCVRDILIKFKKGSIDSIAVGEIKLSFRKSLVKLGCGMISRDPKLQLLLIDLEVVLRPPPSRRKKSASSQRSRSTSRGTWMAITYVIKFISVSVTELVIQTPKANFEIKELNLDIFKDRKLSSLGVKLHLIPCSIFLGQGVSDHECSYFNTERIPSMRETCQICMDKNLAPFYMEELLIICHFGFTRDSGIKIKSIHGTFGEILVNLNEDLLSSSLHSKNSKGISITKEQEEELSKEVECVKTESKQGGSSMLSKKSYMLAFPENVSFTLPKLSINLLPKGQGLKVANNIMGIHLQSKRSQMSDESEESITHCDMQLEFTEIHCLREEGSSILEILKVAVFTSLDISKQLSMPLRAEVDIKLGGTQCNLKAKMLKPWMELYFSHATKQNASEIHPREKHNSSKPHASPFKWIMWTCTLSAPETTVVLYNLDDVVVFHGCSQSSHLYANNITSDSIAVHMELGELQFHTSAEDHDHFSETLLGLETNSGSLLHISRISLDWGQRDADLPKTDTNETSSATFVVEISGSVICLSLQRIQSVLSTFMSIAAFVDMITPLRKRAKGKKVSNKSQHGSKVASVMKVVLERFSIKFIGELSVKSTSVLDPKRVNFGSQGGEVIISEIDAGNPRMAKITPINCSSAAVGVRYIVSLDIFNLILWKERSKKSTTIDVERGRLSYQESSEQKHFPEVTLIFFENGKVIQAAKADEYTIHTKNKDAYGNLCIYTYFKATDTTLRWEPDIHLISEEVMLNLSIFMQQQKNASKEYVKNNFNFDERLFPQGTKDNSSEDFEIPAQTQRRSTTKKESKFALDVENLSLSAGLGDGVECVVQVQSIFSEDLEVGILLEHLAISLNDANILKSDQLQVSRTPSCSNMLKGSTKQSHSESMPSITWDCNILAKTVHIIMPYRLPLRAIEDAIEDMQRGLKLIISSKKQSLSIDTKRKAKNAKKSSFKIGSFKFRIHGLVGEIEEEPIQGWLDEHYRLMKNEVCELYHRLRLLDEAIAEAPFCSLSDIRESQDNKHAILKECTETNMVDDESIKKLKERIHQQAFRSYYKACQNLVPSEGSGACHNNFQAGFKPSKKRRFVLALSASKLEVVLKEIEGGKSGMIEMIKKLDPVSAEMNIPFSRLIGSNFSLSTDSLVLQLRDYSFPMLSASKGKCEGSLIFAQQATVFPPQMTQEVFIGRWHKVEMMRSLSGTTPPLKMYSYLPIEFQKAEVAFGVGFEPVLADISYAFTVALRRANLSVIRPGPLPQIVKKEKNLPWWDDMRYYIHGQNSIRCSEMEWFLLATTDPYEQLDRMRVVIDDIEIQQSDGRVSASTKEFKIYLSSLEHLLKNVTLKLPTEVCGTFLSCPLFHLDVTMDWDCESGNPQNHYLHALPIELVPRDKLYDPFRSTSLSFRWNFALKPASSELPIEESNSFSCLGFTARKSNANRSSYDSTSVSAGTPEITAVSIPTVNLGAHDLMWIFRWWNLYYLPPHKLRSFSRWPRFGVPRLPRSGNLSLDKVITEFMLRVDATPTCIKHVPLRSDDPANGLAFSTTKLKYELCFSRGSQTYTFDCKREPLDLVYQGLDLHMLKAELINSSLTNVITQINQKSGRLNHITSSTENNSSDACQESGVDGHVTNGGGFLFHTDYFTIRKQSPKVDPGRLLSWQEAGRSSRSLETTYVRSEFDCGSENDPTLSDPSDDDGFNVVLADNCQRVFVYGLKLLWTIENRNAVWAWAGEIAKAFESPKPSPSRQYAQRKMMEEQKKLAETGRLSEDSSYSGTSPRLSRSLHPPLSPLAADKVGSSQSPLTKPESSNSFPLELQKGTMAENAEEGTMNFMVNVIQPQFNLHSEEASGRFLLAAASGHVMARSFHTVLHVGYEMIEDALVAEASHISGLVPEMTWKRRELSVMLKHVQAHVAPTDVDPGAGLQWLPEIPRRSLKIKRTGALLERVFMPCTMYFQYTRHKGGTADLKVKPLKELSFNSPNITATMTSRQFHVMVDIISNLLLARLPKPRRSSLKYLLDEDESIEDVTDEVVPDGLEEVELARIEVEKVERECKLVLDDMRTIAAHKDYRAPLEAELPVEHEDRFWMLHGQNTILVEELKKELVNKHKARKSASASLRLTLQRAAQQRLMEKEKNKSPSFAMRISWAIDKVVWTMLSEGNAFAEAEISNMILNVDRDYKDVGVAEFTTRCFVVRNCLPNAKSDMLLSAWNPPPEWGRNVMLRVNAKQGAPKDGNSPLELFQVEIYPLKIYLTETMYKMMWDYFFPEEEQDSQKRQEVWKVSTTAGSKRGKRTQSSNQDQCSSSNLKSKEVDTVSRTSAPGTPLASVVGQSLFHSDPSQLSFLTAAQAIEASKLHNQKANYVTEHQRTVSIDRSWEDSTTESVRQDLVIHGHSSSVAGLKGGSLILAHEQHASSIPKTKETKFQKPGRHSHEEKKTIKSQDEKKDSRARRTREFHSIKISQVELLVTYEGSRLAVNDLRLLMDTFSKTEFKGTWRKLFSRVKKHIIWGVLKSVTGMQGRKFKDKVHAQKQLETARAASESDMNFSDSDGSPSGKYDPSFPVSWSKKPSDRAGEGFVTQIRGLFNTQRRKAKAFVMRTMRGDAENEFHGAWSDSEGEYQFARQLTITKARKLLQRHTKKFRSNRHKGVPFIKDSFQSSSRTTPFQSEADSSSVSSAYEDFHD